MHNFDFEKHTVIYIFDELGKNVQHGVKIWKNGLGYILFIYSADIIY